MFSDMSNTATYQSGDSDIAMWQLYYHLGLLINKSSFRVLNSLCLSFSEAWPFLSCCQVVDCWWFWRMQNAIMACTHFTSHTYFHCKGPAFPFPNISWVPSPLCWRECIVSTWLVHLVAINVSLFWFPFSYCAWYGFIMRCWTKLLSTVTNFRESLGFSIVLWQSPWISHADWI